MKRDEILSMSKEKTIFTWVAQNQASPLVIEKADGIYMWDYDGTRYLDMSSSLVNVNIGFGNKAIIRAIQEQAASLPYIAPKHTYDKRAELGRMLVDEIAPKNMGKALFGVGGADANEYAIRLAKAFSGREKIFSKYESYHGSTYGAANLTGEAERASPLPAIPGFIKFAAPHLYTFDVRFDTEEAAAAHFLNRLEYQFRMEGADSIAALFIESVTGSNGVYLYPKGYLKGLRELCTKYGVLLVCDEIMSGFHRCGEWFACQLEGVEPDIITLSKGVNSGYAPFGAVLISKEMSAFFDTHPLPGGQTLNSHALGVAASIACINEYRRLGTREYVRKLAPKFAAGMEELKRNHPAVGDVRHIGLFGAVELVKNRETREPVTKDKAGNPFLPSMLKALYNEKLATLGHANFFMVAPPLIITEEQLDEMFSAADKALCFADEQI